jgi:glycine betaine/proline transport system substrate-binding protein
MRACTSHPRALPLRCQWHGRSVHENPHRRRPWPCNPYGCLNFRIAPASAQECPLDRPVNMAGLGYESHAFHTEVVATIMREGYGCEVEIIPVETLAGFTGLARGDLDANMEIWTANPPPAWQEGLDDGTLVDLGPNFPAALEGWFVPRYLVEGPDAPAPDLRTPADLARYAELFADPEDPDKGRFYNCVAGWVCEEINTKKLEVYGLTDLYTNFRPGSGARWPRTLSRVRRERPWCSTIGRQRACSVRLAMS